MNDYISAAAEQAAEMLEPALVTLIDLLDGEQPGPVRIAAAKAAIDYALKLADKKEAEAGTLEKLDAILDDFRASVGGDGADGESDDGICVCSAGD